jgi:methyltransferase
MATLKRRWSTRVLVIPGLPVVREGPYRFLRHPNYLAVVVEFFALPLLHTAWITAALFSALNAVVLRTRIRVEEAALTRDADYARILEPRQPPQESLP